MLKSLHLRLWLPLALALSSCGPQSSSALKDAAKASKKTRYPVVLQHGFLGFDKILFMDYFYGVPAQLRNEGYTVYTPHVDAINGVGVRARELAGQIDQILKETGAAKVNIIGHSMGGMDARYLVSTLGYGDRVASISTISTPHQGTHLADLVYFLLGGHQPVEEAMNTLMGVSSDSDTSDAKYKDFGAIDVEETMYNLSTVYAKQHFNPENPDDDRVFYQSWSGQAPWGDISNPDWLSSLLRITYNVLGAVEGDSDGIVSVASSRHGQDNGSFPAHHLDEIGQLFGHQSYNFSYKKFYEDLIADLARRGF